MADQTIMGLVPPAVRMVAVFATDPRYVVLETVHAIALVQDEEGQSMLPVILDEDGRLCTANEYGCFELYEIPKEWHELRFPQTLWLPRLPSDLRSLRTRVRTRMRRDRDAKIIDLAPRASKVKALPILGRINVDTMPRPMLFDLFRTVAEEIERRWPGRYATTLGQESKRKRGRK